MVTEAVLMAGQMASQTSKLVRREEVAEGIVVWGDELSPQFYAAFGPSAALSLSSSGLCQPAHV